MGTIAGKSTGKGKQEASRAVTVEVDLSKASPMANITVHVGRNNYAVAVKLSELLGTIASQLDKEPDKRPKRTIF